jgi:SAM-dependent methyltransferase
MDNQITDRKFWKSYWESKPNLAVSIKKNYVFHRFLKRIVQNNSVKTVIELGGFPGYYALFFKKYFGIKSTLFDYFIDEDILTKVLEKNGLMAKDVEIIEADLFNYKPEKKYDLVLSCGLIEHFEDTKDIISRHVQFLNPGATLFITLPNFTGINGWVQRKFDLPIYEKHNIKSMDPQLLTNICRELNMNEIQASYYGGFNVWLENKQKKPFLTKLLVKLMWFVGKAFVTVIPFNSRGLSPYIVLIAKKQ